MGRVPGPESRAAGPGGGARAFLTDFGLAKSIATGTRLTVTGQALGTPEYMSPEQGRGEVSSLGPATDVWSVGCVLYEMLSGEGAFRASTPAATLVSVMERDPPALRRLRLEVPPDVEAVVGSCLAKDAAGRYRDGAALREDLERVARGERPLVRPPASRSRRLVLAGAALLAGGAALGATAVRARRGAGPASRPPPSAERAGPAAAARARALRASDPTRAAGLLAEA
ncbi:MAG: protein kinase, partial [Planctomycetales bacterium]|nr:protein kinase [Planctomycetales bacterium]